MGKLLQGLLTIKSFMILIIIIIIIIIIHFNDGGNNQNIILIIRRMLYLALPMEAWAVVKKYLSWWHRHTRFLANDHLPQVSRQSRRPLRKLGPGSKQITVSGAPSIKGY